MSGRRTKAISAKADYALDLKKYQAAMHRGNSRRRRVRGFSGRENIMDADDDSFEKDYVAFLLDLEEFAEVRGGEEDEDDPEYMMFLDNLKVRGNSYMLVKSMEDGVPLPIMYEVEEGHSNSEIRRRSRRIGRDEYARKERKFVEEINWRNARSHGVEGTRKVRTRAESMKRKKSRSRGDFNVEEITTSDSSEDTDSNLNIKMTKSIDEVIEEKRIVGKVVKRRKLRSNARNYAQEKFGKLNVNDCPYFSSESSASRKMKTKPVTFDYRQEELKTKKKSPNCHGSDYFPAEQVSGVPNDSRSAPKTSSLKKTAIDEVYKLFMENFKVKGESCVYEYGDKKFVYYDLPSDSRQPTTVAAASSDRLPRDLTVEADSSTQPDAVVAATNDHLPNDWPLTIAAGSSKQQLVTIANASSDHLPNDWSLAIDTDSQPITIAPLSSDQTRREIVFGLSSKVPFRKKRPLPLPSSVQVTVANASSDHLPNGLSLAIDTDSQPITVAPLSCDQTRREIVHGLSSKVLFRMKRPLPLPSSVQVVTQSQPTPPSTSFVPAPRLAMAPFDKQLDNNLEGSHRVPSVMRKKLLKILTRPYCKQEHDLLWKEVNFRSAVLIHRDSRSGGSDRPGHMGRSLLDWNPDVINEIEKVKFDPHKVLNLLRMLAYYIQKQPCGRICKPWMDETLMAILPGSS